MRPDADAARVRALARDLGKHASTRVRMYLTGGATAVLVGWRDQTIDVDLLIEPHDEALARRIPVAKEQIPVNIEFVSPPDFIPELPGWRERSEYAFTEGNVDVYHYDPYSQALSKLERALERDLLDVHAMRDHGMIHSDRLVELFDEIADEIYRYPAINAPAFRERVLAFAAEHDTDA